MEVLENWPCSTVAMQEKNGWLFGHPHFLLDAPVPLPSASSFGDVVHSFGAHIDRDHIAHLISIELFVGSQLPSYCTFSWRKFHHRNRRSSYFLFAFLCEFGMSYRMFRV
jgi:hypothetical protein